MKTLRRVHVAQFARRRDRARVIRTRRNAQVARAEIGLVSRENERRRQTVHWQRAARAETARSTACAICAKSSARRPSRAGAKFKSLAQDPRENDPVRAMGSEGHIPSRRRDAAGVKPP